MKNKLIYLFLFLFLLSACTKDNGVSSEKKIRDSSITWAINDKPSVLDPGLCGYMDGTDVINNMFEGLFRIKNGDVPELAAADSYEESEDKKTYIFKLRDNLYWSDGKKVLAKDFEFAFKRNLRPDFPCPRKELFFPIKNAKEIIDEEKTIRDLGVRAISENKLQIELEYPAENLFQLLSLIYFMPVREDMVDNDGVWSRDPVTAVSNGPFCLKSFGDSNLVLAKNKYYSSEKNTNINNILVSFIADSNTSYVAYISGNLDITDNIPLSECRRLQNDSEFLSAPYYGLYFYSFNLNLDCFKDPKVRAAFSKAIDRKSLIEKVRKTNEIPADGFLHPNLMKKINSDFSYDEDFDVDEARNLMSQAGYDQGKDFPVLEILYNAESDNKIIAQVVASMLKTNLNVDVKLISQEWSVFVNKRKNLEYGGLVKNSYIFESFDPILFYNIFLPGGRSYSGYSDLKYNLILDKILFLSKEDKKNKIIEAEELLREQMPILPLFYYSGRSLVKPYIKNYSVNNIGYKYLGEIIIEEKLR